MTVQEFIKNEVVKSAPEDATIWSYDKFNGYYLFTNIGVFRRRIFLLKDKKVESPLTKKKLLEGLKNEFVNFGDKEIELDIMKHYRIPLGSKGFKIRLLDKRLVFVCDCSREEVKKGYEQVIGVYKRAGADTAHLYVNEENSCTGVAVSILKKGQY